MFKLLSFLLLLSCQKYPFKQERNMGGHHGRDDRVWSCCKKGHDCLRSMLNKIRLFPPHSLTPVLSDNYCYCLCVMADVFVVVVDWAVLPFSLVFFFSRCHIFFLTFALRPSWSWPWPQRGNG